MAEGGIEHSTKGIKKIGRNQSKFGDIVAPVLALVFLCQDCVLWVKATLVGNGKKEGSTIDRHTIDAKLRIPDGIVDWLKWGRRLGKPTCRASGPTTRTAWRHGTDPTERERRGGT